MKKISVGLSVLLFVGFFSASLLPSKQTYDVDGFAHLPVMDEGRRKPIDTLTRNLLTVLSSKSSLRLENGERISANEWFLDAVSGREEALDYQVIRITNMDLLTSLGLEKRSRFRYSYRELLPALPTLEQASKAAAQKDSRDRDLYDREALKLASRLTLLQFSLTAFEDPRLIPAEELFPAIQRYMKLEDKSIPMVVPPSAQANGWQPLMNALSLAHPAIQSLAAQSELRVNPAALMWGRMIAAYALEDVAAFNGAVSAYRTSLAQTAPEQLRGLGFEVAFNRTGVFVKSAALYLLIALLSCIGWLSRRDGLLYWARRLLIWTAVVHTFALIARSMLSGYPPVTNLYSSAIFIGWGAVVLGVCIEGMKRRPSGIGSLIGGITGFVTLLIAHYLAGEGDTLEQMRAVLDTRFWLATHVTTITLGYTATFAAGVVGIFYILAGLSSRRIDEHTHREMDRVLYAITAFALLLSFVGTVLGGLWADDSWGRFWGWDPKENGALLIVTWCAIMLHARWGRMVSTRGFAVMAVFGNVVTAWSWFGVNQLSIGLHSYGFTDSASFWLLCFSLSQIAICAVGMLPKRFWKSGLE